MLELSEIDRIALDVARAAFPRAGVTRVTSQETASWTGEEALDLLIVLTSHAREDRTPDSAMDTLSGISRELQHRGEERFPFIRYATEAELAADPEDDAESDLEP